MTPASPSAPPANAAPLMRRETGPQVLQGAGGSRLARLGPWVVLAWAAIALWGAPDVTWRETLQAAALTVVGFSLLWRLGKSREPSARAWARLGAVLFFLAAAHTGQPAFQTVGGEALTADGRGWTLTRQGAALFAVLALAWLDLTSRAPPPDARGGRPDAWVEGLLRSARPRGGVVALGVGLGAALALARGAGGAVAVWSAVALGASALALRPLLRLADGPDGSRWLRRCALGLLLAIVAGGAGRYVVAGARLAEARRDPQEAVLKTIAAQNAALRSKRIAAGLEAGWAGIAEKEERWREAGEHWRAAAALRGIAAERFGPLLRVAARRGDAGPLWRRLLRDGFPALREPEASAGLEALAARPGGGLRQRLLLALWAWDRPASQAERRARLEAVQELLPNELSSRVLLGRMGEPVPEGQELIFPAELFFAPDAGHEPGLDPFEAEEAAAVAVLDAGRWDVWLEASGSPLREAWPVVRVEFDARPVARIQVDRPHARKYAFHLDVERADVYRWRLVFENGRRLFDRGRLARRRLAVHRLLFRKAPGP